MILVIVLLRLAAALLYAALLCRVMRPFTPEERARLDDEQMEALARASGESGVA